ncbi:FecR domain-containing protein [Sphingomonas sp. IBVSS2]|uniref:FecR family protein n=1 Tax=Sphingomonas sp. IBVSS2 TaxID=1985172 RepID=UPI001181C463|nr:FecR domain-containing protein [Sphingomonas sp. IBVSS2]
MTSASNDSEAADWAIRRENGPLSEPEQRAFETWLAGDERRAGALLRADAALAFLDRGRALAGLSFNEVPHASGYVPDSEPEFGEGIEQAHWLSRRKLVGSGMAALVAVGITSFLALPRTEKIVTQLGEVKRTPLADGSVATVNTASRITVAMSKNMRNISLDDGEAWFEVAHDRARPFVVRAGDVSIRAVGTAFSVRRTDGGVDILVTEGVVEAWRDDQSATPSRIAQGERAFVADAKGSNVNIAQNAVAVRADSEIDRTLAWRNGDLALNGETLDYAVEELNRYNRRKIIVGDRELGRSPIVGYFKVNEPENFAHSVASLFNARAQFGREVIRIDTNQK